MKRKLPDEYTLRRRYLPSVADDILNKIRNEIGDNPIWVSIDETTDAEGRLVF